MPTRFPKPLMLLLILLITLSASLTSFSLAQSVPQQGNPPQFPALMNNPPAYAGDYFHLQKKIYRWSDQTKLVLVHISTASYLPDWQPWNPQIIKDAFGEWQRALNNRVMFVFMDDTTQADMVVNWWNQTTPQVESGAAGVSMSQTWGKYIAKNDIYLSLHHRNGQPHSPQEIYATALHEIGHSLGIKVHSDNPGDIMYYATSERSRLSQRDVNTMLRIYASKPDFTNPPGYHLSRFEDFRKTQKGKGGFWIPIIIPIPI